MHGEKPFTLNADQAVLIEPETVLELDPTDEFWETVTIRFECSHFTWSLFRLRTHMPLELPSATRIMEIAEQLYRHALGKEAAALKSSELMYALLLELKAQSERERKNVPSPSPVLTTYKVMDYIDRHCSQKLRLDVLSKRFGYTPQHLNRIFKKEAGCSVYQYILKVQLERAADMLRNEEWTVEQVAGEVGMEWRSFYRLFQRKYKFSPGEYRKYAKRQPLGRTEV